MKRLSQILFLLVAIVLVACKGNPKDLIARKWSVDVEASKKQNEKEGRNISDKDIQMFQELKFDFQKDGVLELSVLDQKLKGTWSISDDGKKLKMKVGGDEKEEEIEILELSKTKMVGKGKKQTLVLKPAD
ncbi:MAG: hypothetical protein RMJ97_08885 [Raineya sp.]|nr:hypothetical protein [Raineya sp.]